MLDLKFVRENADKVKEAIKNRNGKTEIDQLLKLDEQKRKLLTEVENLKHQKNKASDEIGQMMAKKEDAKAKIAEMKALSQKIKDLDAKVG